MQIAIPIIWSYLFRQYLKVLTFCTLAFIIVMMTIRFGDIVNFISFGAGTLSVLKFAINLMAFVIPYSLPLSCLISSIILIQRLSHTHELTALRASGFSFKDIFTPILLTAGLLSLINFLLISEFSTGANFSNQQLKEEIRQANPLILLHNKNILKLKGGCFETLGVAKVGEYAQDIFLAIPKKGRMHLILSKALFLEQNKLIAEHFTFFSNLESEKENGFDKILIENAAKVETSTGSLSDFLQTDGSSNQIRTERMQILPLLSSLKQHKLLLKKETSPFEKSKLKKNINRYYSDIFRRLSTGLSVITLTLMGLSFGTSIGRHHTNRNLFICIVLAAFYLTFNLMAKEFKESAMLSGFFFFFPHLVIIALSFWTISNVTKGLE